MAWYNQRKQEKTVLSIEQKREIWAAMADGATNEEIADEYDLSSLSIGSLRRGFERKEQKVITPTPITRNESQAIMDARERIILTKLETELAQAESVRNFQIKKNELELEKLQLEIEERRAALAQQYDDDDDFDLAEAAENPDSMMLNLLGKILTKQQASIPPSPSVVSYGPPEDPIPTPPEAPATVPTAQKTLDHTVDQPPEAIKAIIDKQSHGDLILLRDAPKKLIVQGLMKQYPGITGNNIKEVIKQIRHYG